MNRIILIDDDNSFKEAFQIEAQQHGLTLIHKTSFDGLREVMPALLNSVAAVVLDIKCLIHDDQIKEDAGFIGTALKYLDSTCPGFPRIILTGDDSAFASLKSFNPGELIFQKTPDDLSHAFHQLNIFSENSESLKIKRAYADVFSIFEKKLFAKDSEDTLLNTIKNINVTDPSKFGGMLRDIRALQETIFKVIGNRNSAVVPASMFKANGMVKFNDLMLHLNGKPPSPGKKPAATVYQNQAIANMSSSLYWTCGKYIHADPTETYVISNYTLKAMLYCLLEILLWSRQYII
jgi:hypothetical protein